MKFRDYYNKSVLLNEQELTETIAYSDIQDLIRNEVAEPMKKISQQLNDVIKLKAQTLKSWALENYKIEKMSGRSTATLEKIINHPDKVLKQLALKMLGAEAPEDTLLSKI